MTHFLACIDDSGAVVVSSDVPANYVPQLPWVVVDADGLQSMRDDAARLRVPKSVSARQIRLWLVRNGISLASVDAAIDAIPDATQRDSVRVEWDYAPYVERSHPWLVPLASALGMNGAAIDAAFREAATI